MTHDLYVTAITQAADAVIISQGLYENPYFQALRSNSMSIEAFQRSQSQFYFAVSHFSRPMLQLLSRIDDPKKRLDILHNVVEEHGDFHEEKFHASTFEAFLHRIGTIPPKRPAAPIVAFNNALSGIALTEPVETAIAAIGIIEYAFSDISAFIGKQAIMNKFIAEENLIHYNLHAALDKEHAQEFFILIEEEMNTKAHRQNVLTGLDLGVYLFNRLYTDMAHM